MNKRAKKIIRTAKKAQRDGLHVVSQDAEFAQRILTRTLTAGGATLQEEFGFSLDDTARWAKITVGRIGLDMQKDGVG